ncbi:MULTISPECIES: hypothetical protein [Burkholderia cepacia complex]|uniref:hypothetical protein n=1 Tax=Burkholderia cepacia complex TaxID=87882 RepID=UPI00075EB4B8|nr:MULTISPECIES: hypothetical protein [Burkholderia cepacia complex]KVL49971.1 hypothetical protein WT00_18650 [Burkholderia territorii]KWE37373.1 hypothetical protein WT49_11095 [Burkholderia territorii]KWE38413.1 hypothetical protein WT50_19950 [Burkholderia territorii]KWE40292.1 hypothetical protein WT51_27845 [Burkholderia territorii]
MSNAIGNGVSLRGIYDEDSQYAFNLAAGIKKGQDEGKAVSIDPTAPNTVKLAGDGDLLAGRLETIENRVTEGLNVGTVSLEGGLDFPVKAGYAATPGDRLVGGGGGTVRKADPAKDAFGGYSPWCVVEVLASGNVVAIEL